MALIVIQFVIFGSNSSNSQQYKRKRTNSKSKQDKKLKNGPPGGGKINRYYLMDTPTHPAPDGKDKQAQMNYLLQLDRIRNQIAKSELGSQKVNSPPSDDESPS